MWAPPLLQDAPRPPLVLLGEELPVGKLCQWVGLGLPNTSHPHLHVCWGAYIDGPPSWVLGDWLSPAPAVFLTAGF